MSKSRLYAETLSKEDLIELAVVSLDELELTESIEYRDVGYDENDVETKLEVEVPYWIHCGEDLIKPSCEFVHALVEYHKVLDSFREKVYKLAEEVGMCKSEVDELFKSSLPTEEVVLDSFRLGVFEGKSIEHQLLERKMQVNSLVDGFKQIIDQG